MSQGMIARRYAKALVNLAENEKDLDNTGIHLHSITEVYIENSELRQVLSDAKVSSGLKLEIIKDVLSKIKVSKLVDTFIRYILAKRRIDFLPDIERAFNLLLQERLGRIEAKVTTASELQKDTVKKLVNAISSYSGKEIEVNVTIDPSIIGGVITRIGSTVIDGSIQTYLNQIRKSIIRG
tara:strand:- start:28 stop:570 length:543 start_codon:yes stop_codon:yes gene_type:complete